MAGLPSQHYVPGLPISGNTPLPSSSWTKWTLSGQLGQVCADAEVWQGVMGLRGEQHMVTWPVKPKSCPVKLQSSDYISQGSVSQDNCRFVGFE